MATTRISQKQRVEKYLTYVRQLALAHPECAVVMRKMLISMPTMLGLSSHDYVRCVDLATELERLEQQTTLEEILRRR